MMEGTQEISPSALEKRSESGHCGFSTPVFVVAAASQAPVSINSQGFRDKHVGG